MARILVIEDNESFSLLLSSVLREAGHEVFSAFSGREGIKSALAFLPAIVLLDYHLGDMTGYDVALGIKMMRATVSTPFVLLSSMG
jgi:DNA-binding response OmpR family regulator